MSAARPTALIADDEPLLRESLARQLATVWPELDVVAQVRNGRDAVKQFEALSPDVCFLDVHMPGLSGVDAAKHIGRRAHLVFITAYDHYAVQAFAQGALDYLTREELQGMVAHELTHLHEGDTRLKMRLAGMVFGLELVYNFGDTLRERRGLAWWFGSAIMLAGFAGWITGRMLKAAVSRQREYLADARAVQWTRSRDGLGGVLRKVMAQRRGTPKGYEGRSHTGLSNPSVQHMLLVDVDGSGRMAQWLDSHPTLDERVRRVYGRSMQPIKVAPVAAAPEPAWQPQGGTAGQPAGATLASLVDPFARHT